MTVTPATTAALSQTRSELRRALADRFGDLTQLTTTSSGSSTTLIDALNVNAGSEHFNGRQLLITSGTYSGTKARVTGTTDSTGTLTFTPAAGGTIASGVTVDVFNRRGIGFTIAEYDRALNSAINDAFPMGMIELIDTLTTGVTVTDDVTTILVPAKYFEVYALEYKDEREAWHPIPKATITNGYGWRARADGYLEVQGLPQRSTDDETLRLRGYGRQDTLSADTAECGLNFEWLIARAAYHLALGALMRGTEYGSLANQFARDAEASRTRLRVLRHPSSERVRSY